MAELVYKFQVLPLVFPKRHLIYSNQSEHLPNKSLNRIYPDYFNLDIVSLIEDIPDAYFQTLLISLTHVKLELNYTLIEKYQDDK